jgi:hypothetical protein
LYARRSVCVQSIAALACVIQIDVMTAKSPRNFHTYAAMEAGNTLLLPGAALLLATPKNFPEMVAMGLAITSCAGFLLIGAAYWWSLDRRLRCSDRRSIAQALALADRLEVPLLATTAAAAGAIVYVFFRHGWTSPVTGAALLALLAVLEYVNYYHRQLQHFDNWNAFKRLITRFRLPRAHMARDLAAYRSTRRSAA